MSGSRLGRGRGGRLAVYGGCGVVVILLVFLYRAATSEMARLRELHVQCAHQQEALAAQLQVIFEYKVRLEKSLAEEKSSNAAAKQELQQRASREKSLRDKDSIEAMQRFNSLQQTYKILQTEHQDLQDEYKKREKQALEDTKKLEATLQELRGRIKRTQEDKSLEHLKNKYLELEHQKERDDERYRELRKSHDIAENDIDRLKKQVLQLKRELEETKQSPRTSPGPSLVSPQPLQQSARPASVDGERSAANSIRKSGQQQQQQQQQYQQSSAAPRGESSTKSGASVGSTSMGRPAPRTRTGSKVKIPHGVVPIRHIPLLPQDNQDNEENEGKDEVRRKNDADQNASLKNHLDPASREKQVEGIIETPVRQGGEQILGMRDKNWFHLGHGVQEVGDDLNQLDNLRGPDDGMDRQAGDDDQYADVDLDEQKNNPQKNNDIRLVGGGDEAEDEED